MTKLPTPDELRKLPVEERLQMIEDIWESLDHDAGDLPLPDWQREELDRRLDALENGTSTGSSWDDVRRRITGKL